MPIWLHLVVCLVGQIAGAFLALSLYYALEVPATLMAPLVFLPAAVRTLLGFALLLVVVAGGVYASLALITWAVPARCARAHCRGRTYLVSNVPYTYRCTRCADLRTTRIFQAGRGR